MGIIHVPSILMVMTTNIITDEALDKILSGAKKLYDAVSVTMGPRGHNVIIKKKGKKAAITHDGVTVARAIKFKDQAEEATRELFEEGATILESATGDGTTTVTVLTYHILKGAAELIKQGENPMKLKLALDALVPSITAQIDANTIKDVTEQQLVQVAQVASGSQEIGKDIGTTVFKAGKDTPIVLGFSESTETVVETIDGFKVGSGPASPYLMSGIRTEILKPKIILCDAKLRDKEDVMPILTLFAGLEREERNFLLVASDIAGDALTFMVMNNLKGFANIAVARVPQYIGGQTEYLADMAVATGATVLSRNSNYLVREPKMEHFGSAERAIVEPGETIIVNGSAIPEDLKTHIAMLESYAKTAKDAVGRKFAKDRLSMLNQKVVSMLIGGQSETEAEEKMYRYEDATGACQAALRGGVVAGGGTLLFAISVDLLVHKDDTNFILTNALRAPLFKILDNAGVSTDEMIIKVGQGIDVIHPEDGVIDLAERGILDPAESELECVKTAISIAGLLITSGAMVIDEEEENEVKQELGMH